MQHGWRMNWRNKIQHTLLMGQEVRRESLLGGWRGDGWMYVLAGWEERNYHTVRMESRMEGGGEKRKK